MRAILRLLATLLLTTSLACAQATFPPSGGTQQVAPAPGALFGTNAVQTCGSMAAPVATFNAAGQTASLSCPGAGSYDIRIVPTASAPLVGTFTSADLALPGAPSGRRLYKNGVGPLEVSTESLTATNTGPLTYRVNGGDNLTLTLTGYTSGSAAVYITASYAASMVLINGSIDSREEAALRQGKAFTASTGTIQVTAGNALALMLTNPATSGVRLVIPMLGRVVACNNPSSALLPAFVSLPNPTSGSPTTAITPTRRGGSSGTSAAAVAYANSATVPAVSPAPTTLVGNPFFGTYAVAQDRTLEPGSAIVIYIVGVAIPSGLGSTNASCSILMSWFEESLN